MHQDTRRTVRAIRLAAGLRGFVAHVLLFGVAHGLAILLDLDWRYFWPLVGWTVGLAFHGIAALGPGQWIGSAREEEWIEQLAATSRKP